MSDDAPSREADADAGGSTGDGDADAGGRGADAGPSAGGPRVDVGGRGADADGASRGLDTSAGSAEGGASGTDILARQIRSGLNELERPASGLLLSGLSAGLDIGFGPLFMAVVLTLTAGVYDHATQTLLVSNAYAIGFVFVVLGRSELFTEHTTLAVLPVLDRRSTIRALLRLWGLVYVGNLVGSAVFAVALVWLGPAYGVVGPDALVELAVPLLDHGVFVTFAGAVLAGWLMGLLSWIVAGADDTASRLLVVWLIAAAIGLAHLPHSIAGSVEVLSGLLTAHVASLVFVRFLVVSTVGNAVGGVVFVALLKYGHVVRGGE